MARASPGTKNKNTHRERTGQNDPRPSAGRVPDLACSLLCDLRRSLDRPCEHRLHLKSTRWLVLPRRITGRSGVKCGQTHIDLSAILAQRTSTQAIWFRNRIVDQPETVAATAPRKPSTLRTIPTIPQVSPAVAIPRPGMAPADLAIMRLAERPNAMPATPRNVERIANAPATRAPHPGLAPTRPRHAIPSATRIDAIPAISEPIASPEVTGGTLTYPNAKGVPPTG